jgi:uncharacterized membrane protein YgaE (UPF0421/DUF939 family)
LTLRVAVAAIVSLYIAQLLGLKTPIFAFIAAIIVTDLDPAQSRRLGLRRIGATVVGAICGAVFSHVIDPTPWTIGASLAITMLICLLLRSPDGAKVAGFTCGIILLIPGEGGPWGHAFLRFVETVLGVCVAWSISYVPKLIRIGEPEARDA